MITLVMIHPYTELKYISDEIGYGLVAKQLIPQGSIIWVLDELDREFTPAQLDRMSPDIRDIFENYTFRNNKGNYVITSYSIHYTKLYEEDLPVQLDTLVTNQPLAD